eukprot:COSAG02_NODE_7129_length_3168_cov_1.659172_1_plen_115_part_00
MIMNHACSVCVHLLTSTRIYRYSYTGLYTRGRARDVLRKCVLIPMFSSIPCISASKRTANSILYYNQYIIRILHAFMQCCRLNSHATGNKKLADQIAVHFSAQNSNQHQDGLHY